MGGAAAARRSGPPRLHRRDLDQDQHGSAAGLGAARRAPAGQGGPWPLEDDDLPRRLAARPGRGAILDGPINGETFRLYVDKVLVPTLRQGDIVVMDNLGSHKSKAVRRAIRAAGARLLFLPKYSPDLNPIEQLFSKLKHWLRRAAARTTDAVCNALGPILETVTPDECSNYFARAGYRQTQIHPALASQNSRSYHWTPAARWLSSANL